MTHITTCMKHKKPVLRLFSAVLAAGLLLSAPSAQAKYFNHFGFGLGTTDINGLGDAVPLNNAAAAGDANVNSKQGFSVAYSANHLFEYKGSSYSANSAYHTMTNLRTGYYAFVLRRAPADTEPSICRTFRITWDIPMVESARTWRCCPIRTGLSFGSGNSLRANGRGLR